MKRQVGQAHCPGPIQGPLEPLQPLSPPGGFAKAAGLLDRLRSRVVFAGKTEHRPAHRDPRGAGDLRKRASFLPARMVRIAASNLHQVDSEPAEQPLELGYARDLKAPTTDSQAQGSKR